VSLSSLSFFVKYFAGLEKSSKLYITLLHVTLLGVKMLTNKR
jgi:hypothetical protein